MIEPQAVEGDLPVSLRTRTRLLSGMLSLHLLAALALLVLGPKISTAFNVNAMLWGNIRGLDYLLVSLQDIALFCLLGFGSMRTLRSRPALFSLWWALLFVVTLFLVIDCRSRSFWLKPIDLAQIRYFFAQLSTLQSSAPAFFAGGDALGLSFKRLLALWFALFSSALISALILRRVRARHELWFKARSRPRVLAIGWLTAALSLGAVALGSPRFIYAIEQNLFVSPVLSLLTPRRAAADLPPFEQPIRKLREVMVKPRQRLAGAAPFRNLVLVMLESFRYRGNELPRAKHAPNLSRFAQEGMWAKTYVTVPHSSKGHYAVLTGRAPSSGIEIREALALTIPSFVSELRMQRKANTSAFSTTYLGFENTDGLLRGAGVTEAVGPEQLVALNADPNLRASSSYGVDDAALVDAPALSVAKQGKQPFATLLMTINTHHPYLYPGKLDPTEDGIVHYERAIRHMDDVLGRIVAAFDRRGLADDTLFVFVADHGESFGEHGATMHNNSLYEEEITVPLVFWSKDGRLRQDKGLEARQIDVAPTILDLMGVTDSSLPVQGVSLLREQRPAAFVSTFFEGVAQALVLDEKKYLYFVSNERLVRFDLRKDPHEKRPAQVTGHERSEIMRQLLAAQAYEASTWNKTN